MERCDGRLPDGGADQAVAPQPVQEAPDPWQFGCAATSLSKMARTIRVLVVDDTAAVREAVTDMLTDLGIKAGAAISGRAALKLCAGACPFDVILADVVMGDIDGIQLAETLREAYPKVPVILMTGRESLVDGVVGAGVMPLLKPFGALQLMRVINEALSRHD
jgi:CheY-like chemotaxis protein